MLKYFGAMCIGAGFSVLLPLLTLIFFTDEAFSFFWYAFPGSVAIFLGYVFITVHKYFFCKNYEKNFTQSEKGESAAVVLVGWLFAIVVNAFPFILSGRYSVAQSFFEAVSGLTTTGLSIVDVENTLHIVLMHRSIMLFFGGIGIVLSVLFFLNEKGGLRLYEMEGHNDMLAPNVVKSSRTIIFIYSFYIIAGSSLYKIGGMSFFDAINHSIAAISTGGFSTHAESIGYFKSDFINIVTIFLMIAGSTNFLIHLLLITGKWKQIISYSETKMCFTLLLIFVPFVSFFLYKTGFKNDTFLTALFQCVSAVTTTGFQTVESFSNLHPFVIHAIIVLMLAGGGTGSTAGGIKQYRICIALKNLVWNIRESFDFKNTIFPHHVNDQNGKNVLDSNLRQKTLSFILIYLLCFMTGTFILCAAGFSISESMFEIASSLGTVGLSCGVISAASPDFVLWTCSFAMFLGRMEIYVFIFGVIYGIKKIGTICKF